jgi:hypothetical protein
LSSHYSPRLKLNNKYLGDVGANANIFETLSNKSGRFYFSHSGTRRLFLVRLAATYLGDVGANANIFETLSNKSGRFYFSHSGTRRLFLVRLAAISKNENFEFFHNVTL